MSQQKHFRIISMKTPKSNHQIGHVRLHRDSSEKFPTRENNFKKDLR